MLSNEYRPSSLVSHQKLGKAVYIKSSTSSDFDNVYASYECELHTAVTVYVLCDTINVPHLLEPRTESHGIECANGTYIYAAESEIVKKENSSPPNNVMNRRFRTAMHKRCASSFQLNGRLNERVFRIVESTESQSQNDTQSKSTASQPKSNEMKRHGTARYGTEPKNKKK